MIFIFLFCNKKMTTNNSNNITIFHSETPHKFNTIGLFTFLRTYSRRHKENDPNSTIESWEECLNRIVNACNNQLNLNLSRKEQKELFQLLFDLKCSVAGRFMWQLGTTSVEKLGLPSLQNCCFVVVDEPVRPFTWAMDFLMLGAGVGYRILPTDVEKLPKIKKVVITRKDTHDADFIVPDSREGWVKLLGKVLKAYFLSGKDFTYSCILLRSKGAPIKGFGGLASGPETLCEGISKICSVLDKRDNQNLIPVDCLDIMNIIGMIVVSGNVRRCVPYNSLVITQRGEVEISSLNKETDYVLTREGFQKINNIFNQGKQYVIKITTEHGILYCTKEHQLCINNNDNDNIWIKAKELKINDYLLWTDAKNKNIVKTTPTKVLNIIENYKNILTYDIEVENVPEFFCDGFLVHNSAQIALGDVKDYNYLSAKDWSSGSIPNWRAFSNNSVVCNDINDIIDSKEFWAGYEGNGEPYGLINIGLMKKCGRLTETQYADPSVEGTNPCAEICLSNFETCCLGELYLPNITSAEELQKCTKYIYRICKHSLTLPCQNSQETENIVHKNMRIGIGITGWLQSTPEQKSWISDCYEMLREYDKEYSLKLGFPTSIKLTTIKPSGCMTENTRISTNEGLLKLSDIGDTRKHSEVWQDLTEKKLMVYDKNGQEYQITKFFKNGRDQTIKFVLENGLEIESTREHKYLVFKNDNYVWVSAKEFVVGDKLILRGCDYPYKTNNNDLSTRENTNSFTYPRKLTKELSWLIGFLYSQNTLIVDDTQGISFLVNEMYKNKLSKLFQDCFNTYSCWNSSIFSIPAFLTNFFDINNIKIRNSIFPDLFLMCDKEFMFEFFNGAMYIPNSKFEKQFLNDFIIMSNVLKKYIKISHYCDNVYTIENDKNFSVKCLEGLNPLSERGILDNNLIEINIREIHHQENETYDISVDKVEHYQANGIIAHNTLSLLAGTTSGIHPAYSKYYIRRIRIASESPLIKIAKEHGYFVEPVKRFDGTNDHSTMIIEFPFSFPNHTITAEECSAVQQLEFIKEAQTLWADNSVSCTITYKKEELPEIKDWLRKNYNNNIKSVSFLLHSGHGFIQAPIEPITKEKYEELMKRVKPIENLAGICYTNEEQELLAENECAGGVCPIK